MIYQSVKKGTQLNQAIEETLKGKEIQLPDGITFSDKDGAHRTEIRTKWWENPAMMTYKSISVEPIENLPDSPIVIADLPSQDFYQSHDKKVFFGHYWLKGEPCIYRKHVLSLIHI